MINSNDLFLQAKEGQLPFDFADWGMTDENGLTIADIAMENGVIPQNFDPIRLYNNRYTFAHVLARIGGLPANYKDWQYTDVLGWSVAHEAAASGNLSEDFDDWYIKEGDLHRTVLYTAATHGTFPLTFSVWEMVDDDETAHWTISDNPGGKIVFVAVSHDTLPSHFNKWEIINAIGCTVAHEAARYGTLPKDFSRWDLANEDGRTVAHEAARHGRLPPNFSRWDLADEDGWTVAEEAALYNLVSKRP